MIGEAITKRVHARKGSHLSRFEVYAWFFMRISGAVLLVMAVFHLLYMHFIIPGGVSAIDHTVIITRWRDPVWGLFWRTFDLLLLAFSLAHGSNGVRIIVEDYLRQESWRLVSKIALYLACAILFIMGAMIILSFNDF